MRRALVTCLAVAASVSLAASSPARADRAADARANLGQLESAESDALLDLFAADSAVGAPARVPRTLRSRAHLQADRVADARREVTVGRTNLEIAQTTLSTRLAAAFRAGDVDPFVILLSASSLSDALDSIAIVNRVSARDAMLIGNVERGVASSRRAERALTAEQTRLTAASAAADAEAGRVVAARDAKAALVASLRNSKQIAARRLTQIEAAAAAAHDKAAAIDDNAADTRHRRWQRRRRLDATGWRRHGRWRRNRPRTAQRAGRERRHPDGRLDGLRDPRHHRDRDPDAPRHLRDRPEGDPARHAVRRARVRPLRRRRYGWRHPGEPDRRVGRDGGARRCSGASRPSPSRSCRALT